MHDWPLLGFTLLVQASVGGYVVLEWIRWAVKRNGQSNTVDRTANILLLILLGLAGLAMLFSLAHLGRPLRAPLAIGNLKQSWLSREILLVLLFSGGLALNALLRRLDKGSDRLRTILAWATVFFGLSLIFIMARLYMMPAVPVWNTWTTPAAFYAATFLLGALGMLAGFHFIEKRNPSGKKERNPSDLLPSRLKRTIGIGALILLCGEILLYTGLLAVLKGHPVAGLASLENLFNHNLILVLIRTGLNMAAVTLIGFGPIFSLRPLDAENASPIHRQIYLVFALVLISEIIGRILFYASYARVGL